MPSVSRLFPTSYTPPAGGVQVPVLETSLMFKERCAANLSLDDIHGQHRFPGCEQAAFFSHLPLSGHALLSSLSERPCGGHSLSQPSLRGQSLPQTALWGHSALDGQVRETGQAEEAVGLSAITRYANIPAKPRRTAKRIAILQFLAAFVMLTNPFNYLHKEP